MDTFAQTKPKFGVSRKLKRDATLISIGSESRASAQAKEMPFTKYRAVKLISIDSASSISTQEEAPRITDSTTESSSPGSGGNLLPKILTSNNPAQTSLLSPPLEPQQPLNHHQQPPATTLNAPIDPPQRPADMAPIRQPRPNTLTPERDIPKDPNCVTMDEIIDRYYLPTYLASHFPIPTHMDAKRRVKKIYIQQVRDRHAKLAVQVEAWRQNIPMFEGPGWMWDSSPAPESDILEHKSQRAWRPERDRRDLTDFVNGKLEGVNRARLMCWPMLITAKAFAVWYRPDRGESPVNLQRMNSVDDLHVLGVLSI